MKKLRLLPLLIVLLTLTLNCLHGRDDVLEALPKDSGTETLWQQDSQRERSEALLSDASHLYRICNTRPQRLLPSQGAQHERSSGKLPFGWLTRHSFTLKHTFGGSPLQSLPLFRFAASCDYYVYALRRILR